MRTAQNAFWLTACRLSGDVLNLLLFVLISRQFGPAGVGEYSYGFAIATFVFVIGCLGIYEYGIRQYARMEPARQPVFLAELLGTQTVMLAIALAGLAIYLLATGPTLPKLVIIFELACYQITAAVAMSLFIPEMAAQRMAGPALSELAARAVAFIGAGIAIYAAHASLPSALLGFPFGALVWMTLAIRSARRRGPLRVTLSRAGVGRIGGIIWSFALIEIFGQLFARVGVIVLSLAVSDAAAGQFATGLRLIDTAIVPLGFLGIAMYPRLSQLFGTDLPVFRRSASDLLLLSYLAGLLVAWGLYFVAPSVLVPVLGARFAGTEGIIQLMAAVALVQAIEAGLGRVLLSADLQVPRALYIAAGAVVSVGVNVALVPRFGLDGAIVAAVAAYLVINLLSLAALRRPMTLGALIPSLVMLGAGVLLVMGIAWLLARQGWGVAAQAAATGAAVLLVAAVSYGYRLRFRAAALVR